MKLVVTLGIAGFAAMVVGAQIPAAQENDPIKTNVLVLRVVNTVEASLGQGDQSYKPLSAVLEAPMFKERFNNAGQLDSVSATVGAHRLVLVVSPDLKHYQAMVSTGESCAITMFTNEKGLIYSGQGLGCDKEK